MRLMNKKQAMGMVNEYLGDVVLRGNNTTFAKKPDADAQRQVWWLEIDPQNFTEERHILLANDPGLIWLRIKANTFQNPEKVFKIRQDKDRVALEISNSGSPYLCDIRNGGTGYNFRRHIEREW